MKHDRAIEAIETAIKKEQGIRYSSNSAQLNHIAELRESIRVLQADAEHEWEPSKEGD